MSTVMKSHASTRPDSEAHNKAAEVGAAFTGSFCPLALRGA